MPIVLNFVEEGRVFEFHDINEAIFTLGTYVPKDATDVPEEGMIVVKGESFPFTKEDFKIMMEQIDEYEKMGKALSRKAMKVLKKPMARKAMKQRNMGKQN